MVEKILATARRNGKASPTTPSRQGITFPDEPCFMRVCARFVHPRCFENLEKVRNDSTGFAENRK
jgi:hypothetical protein